MEAFAPDPARLMPAVTETRDISPGDEIMIEAVNLALGVCISSSGESFPITNMFDTFGEPCGPDDAVSVVAGRDKIWFALDLTQFTHSVN